MLSNRYLSVAVGLFCFPIRSAHTESLTDPSGSPKKERCSDTRPRLISKRELWLLGADVGPASRLSRLSVYSIAVNSKKSRLSRSVFLLFSPRCADSDRRDGKQIVRYFVNETRCGENNINRAFISFQERQWCLGASTIKSSYL